MASRSRGAWRALMADPTHGPLPALLLILTVVTGLVDAVSILSLGRVFVANMTGNVVFIGFALAQAPGFSLSASVVALAGFLVGAGAGGVAARRLGRDRAVLLAAAGAAEMVLLSAALVVAVASMLGGAVVGAELVLHVRAAAALGALVGLLAVVTASASLLARRPGAWRIR